MTSLQRDHLALAGIVCMVAAVATWDWQLALFLVGLIALLVAFAIALLATKATSEEDTEGDL
ncbi:MAG TPA: hypothetical protein VJB57_04125 [Dehalococcoidia bacterium]|nr:hypothetical protein [Dehalococcoidia bacterium]